jgi:hypothetical protein
LRLRACRALASPSGLTPKFSIGAGAEQTFHEISGVAGRDITFLDEDPSAPRRRVLSS